MHVTVCSLIVETEVPFSTRIKLHYHYYKYKPTDMTNTVIGTLYLKLDISDQLGQFF